MPDKKFPMVRDVPYMGVIWAVYEASKLGYYNGHPDWCNLGQGQPEVGEMAESPERINHIDLEPCDNDAGTQSNANDFDAREKEQIEKGHANAGQTNLDAIGQGGECFGIVFALF